MSAKPVIAVIGGIGAQGSSVIKGTYLGTLKITLINAECELSSIQLWLKATSTPFWASRGPRHNPMLWS